MDNKEREAQDREPEAEKSKNAVHRLYDKLPFTFKQVDIFVKVMVALMVALLIYGIVKGGG